ncbi:MAG: peptidase C15 [Cyanobacteria bacterium J06639_14]
MPSLLLTSFAPWRAHQPSNASDDLICLLQDRQQIPADTVLIRQLPVHFQLAPCQVIAAMVKVRPAVVVCCGMAERRSLLTLERSARWEDNVYQTSLALDQLCLKTQWTEISDDAGTYVCNHLYYRLLAYVHKHRWPIQCLFIHVPPVTEHNREFVIHDFASILLQLSTSAHRLQRQRPEELQPPPVSPVHFDQDRRLDLGPVTILAPNTNHNKTRMVNCITGSRPFDE